MHIPTNNANQNNKNKTITSGIEEQHHHQEDEHSQSTIWENQGNRHHVQIIFCNHRTTSAAAIVCWLLYSPRICKM
jgi:hypothetical protein